MNVLFVTREYPPFEIGGVAIHTLHLVRNLKKIGVSCKVLSFGNDKYSTDEVTFVNPSSSIIERDNATVALDSKIPADIMRFSKIANKLLEKEKFDVIHVEEPYVGAFISSKHGETKLCTFHDTSFGEIKAIMGRSFSGSSLKRTVFYTSLGFFLESMSIASSRGLIVPTPQVRDELIDIYRTPKNKIKIIENGVELPQTTMIESKAALKRKLNINPDGILIFSLARMVSRKRLELLIKAIKVLQTSGDNLSHVIIAGDGPERSNLTSLVKKYGLNDMVEMPGWISEDQKELLFQAADIFVLTSDYEGFPFTMLEAMSYGVPIINSKIKSLSPLREGIDGLLFPAGDFRALSGCIKSIEADASLRTRLSASARTFAEKHSWKNIAQQTLSVYEAFQ